VNLGTQKHLDKYLDGISNLTYPGCFAMTELHHGSNVQGIQTTAIFDRMTDEFIINTPNEGALKWWIGNAAVHGKFASVFARLLLPSPDSHLDTDMGVHAFIVPIRSMEDHSVLPGIEIHDCGFKIGLNGVDNGALRFDNVFFDTTTVWTTEQSRNQYSGLSITTAKAHAHAFFSICLPFCRRVSSGSIC
jgi:acyl-CoA oxidase